ncbi:hypothetical protein [Staphylococcus cohnii]|nr:hypothetical protein [Staphylococcus cohnii]WQJ59527.1 hypothetical protein P3T93_12825 [Staphylococcus cohnii]
MSLDSIKKYILALIILLGGINVFDLFMPIISKENTFNVFYLLIFNFVFPILLLAVFILSLINSRKIIVKEGSKLTNLLVLAYGLFILFNFWVINYQPYFIYHFQEGLVVKYLTFVFWYMNIVFIYQILYSKIISRLAYYKKPDYIIILGSGLIGEDVPPLTF